MDVEKLRARQSEIQMHRSMLDREEAEIVEKIRMFYIDDHELALGGIANEVEARRLAQNG